MGRSGSDATGRSGSGAPAATGHRHRRDVTPDSPVRVVRATVVAAALAGGLALTSCAPATRASAPDRARETRALAELHEWVRAPGLEDRRFRPEHYWDVVLPVLEDSGLEVDEVGRSAEGRPLREVRFGSGPITVLLWSQMHGDESTASMALADLFNYLGGEGGSVADGDDRREHLRERLSLHVVPVLNPDGAARFQRRNSQGVDVNRDARQLQTPEGRTLKAVRDRIGPDYAFNLHDQNVRTRVGRTDRGVAIALLAPAFDEERNVNDRRERAMRLASLIRLTVEPLVGGHVARYDDTFNPRAFGDLMSAWGSSAVLIESGGWQDDPQKQYLRKVNFVAILEALSAIAEDRVGGISTRPYLDLPENGRSVGDLLLVGGTLAVPGLPLLEADVLVRYERPLLEERGIVDDVGDLGGYEARDTVAVEGLYLVPMEGVVDEDGALRVGAPARFLVARDPEGGDVVWRFEGGPVPDEARVGRRNEESDAR